MFLLDTNTVIDYVRSKGKITENLLALPPSEVRLNA